MINRKHEFVYAARKKKFDVPMTTFNTMIEKGARCNRLDRSQASRVRHDIATHKLRRHEMLDA
jgi:hypothetical protein